MSSKQRKAGRLRSPQGTTIEFPDLPTVQEWIAEGRVDRGFEIYDRKKRRWRLVEDIPDLAGFILLREANAAW
jgi:hypothetical protein